MSDSRTSQPSANDSTAQIRRLFNFVAVYEQVHGAAVLDRLDAEGSLGHNMPIVVKLLGSHVAAMAAAFVYRQPYLNLENLEIDHATLVAICPPARIGNYTYAAIGRFGRLITVVCSDVISPEFRNGLKGLLEPGYTFQLVTAPPSYVKYVAEVAQAVAEGKSPENIPAPTPVVAAPPIAKPEKVEVSEFSEIRRKCDEFFRKWDRDTTKGFQAHAFVNLLATSGMTSLHASVDTSHSQIHITGRLGNRFIELANFRSSLYASFKAALEEEFAMDAAKQMGWNALPFPDGRTVVIHYMVFQDTMEMGMTLRIQHSDSAALLLADDAREILTRMTSRPGIILAGTTQHYRLGNVFDIPDLFARSRNRFYSVQAPIRMAKILRAPPVTYTGLDADIVVTHVVSSLQELDGLASLASGHTTVIIPYHVQHPINFLKQVADLPKHLSKKIGMWLLHHPVGTLTEDCEETSVQAGGKAYTAYLPTKPYQSFNDLVLAGTQAPSIGAQEAYLLALGSEKKIDAAEIQYLIGD